VLVGRARETTRPDPRVDRLREERVFDKAHALAWEVGEPAALSRRLHAAVAHDEDDTAIRELGDFLR